MVDGEEYFRAVREAIEAARDSVLILAWDFDSRAGLGFGPDGRVTLTVGDLLNRWARGGPGRRVNVLIWDYPMIYGLEREFPPIYGLGWKPDRRVEIRYDGSIPMGASHHQKLVVIDDRVAFCGGLDLTGRRWDTCAHRVADERRRANGKTYPPFHDAMMAVSGDAARALGELARERWRKATGESLAPPGAGGGSRRWGRWAARRHGRPAPPADPWPGSLPVALAEIEVAISRTEPAAGDAPAVRETEAMYLDLIAAARRSIYIENQYFTAHRLGEELARRLAEPEGP
jgi:phosphatidylserine/phosphatidylglycerophosphate/cardiolipin synthase-like enzyme